MATTALDPEAGRTAAKTVVVDGNNVMGSVADGWWRDRPAAVRRLLRRVQCYQHRTGDTVILVLDVPQADLPEGHHEGVEICYPRRRGRDAADERILELLDERGLGTSGMAGGAESEPDTDGDPDDAGDTGNTDGHAEVEVVTSDRRLAGGARRRNATVLGARSFLARLDTTGC